MTICNDVQSFGWRINTDTGQGVDGCVGPWMGDRWWMGGMKTDEWADGR